MTSAIGRRAPEDAPPPWCWRAGTEAVSQRSERPAPTVGRLLSEILVVIPISVVIPTKNRAELLEQTLRSVAAQSLRPSQIVVADDGSVDATAEVVARYGATHVCNARGDWGAGAGRNAASERVRTEYVSFVDSDDLLLPERLALL